MSLEGDSMNLEGKKAHLEGTWRAVAGRLEGKGESQQSLIQSRSIAIIGLTWRVFGKNIYTECGKNVNRMHTKEVDHEQ
jgi:hypothetical protein